MASWLEPVARYYSETIAHFGATPRGVDWNGLEAQETRFARLARLFDGASRFSLNDLGCGYGALYDYLTDRGHEVDYRGYDIAPPMLDAARRRARPGARLRLIAASEPTETADYSVASGIFNVRLGAPLSAWTDHVHATLDAMHRTSRLGFAFNCLTSHSDPSCRRDDLYYADPGAVLDRCLTRYSRRVSLVHDDAPFEFTCFVRTTKPP
jgi:SAM-dependent methyltransferase